MSEMLIPSIPINDAIKELTNIYVPMIKSNIPFESIPSPFLWGPPGCGKSDAVRELAVELEAKTGKKVNVTDIRLLLFSPIDLRGVPVADETKTFTNWLKPKILDLDDSEDVVNLLFLDELSAAPQSVQAAAYQITLNRAIGEHKLPDNTIVVAAGNRSTDRAVSFTMPSALANRMCHFNIRVDFNTWKEWALKSGNVNPLVLGYLSYDSDKLYLEDRSLEEIAYPTPRSWMFVSNILNTVGKTDDINDYFSLIAGCIGSPAAIEFIAWTKVYKNLPTPEEIVRGKKKSFQGEADTLYALISVLSSYVARKETETEHGLSTSEIDNACKFVATLPPDYAMLFYLNILPIGDINLKLAKSQSFIMFSKLHGKALSSAWLTCALGAV